MQYTWSYHFEISPQMCRVSLLSDEHGSDVKWSLTFEWAFRKVDLIFFSRRSELAPCWACNNSDINLKIIISYHSSETSHQIIFFCSLKAEHFPETHIKWIKSDPLKWYFKLTSIPLIFHPFTSREQLFALSRQVIFSPT